MILQLDCFWMDFLEVMCIPVIVAVPDQGRALHGKARKHKSIYCKGGRCLDFTDDKSFEVRLRNSKPVILRQRAPSTVHWE